MTASSPGPIPENFDGETLRHAANTPEETSRARLILERAARDDADRQLLHDTVFGTPRPTVWKRRQHDMATRSGQ
jgi:hypothetical protein